jgi:GAF domain-containing protein
MTSSSPNRDVRQARGSHGQPIESGLAREMSELARELQAESDHQKLLGRIIGAAVSDIPHATYAGLSLFTKHRVHTDAASDPLVEQVDQAQYAAGEGPCLEAGRTEKTVRADDLEHERRWPTFAARAVALGVRAMLSVQLFVENDAMGALNLYSHEAEAFDDDDENIALLLGAHAAVAMSASRMRANFDIALSSRDLIGQAKGILMERYKIDGMQAFEMLVWASQHSHMKLRDVAQQLAETGEFEVR